MGGDVAYGVVEEDQGTPIPAAGLDSPGTPGASGGTDRPLVIAELRGHPFGTDPAGVQVTGRRVPSAGAAEKGGGVGQELRRARPGDGRRAPPRAGAVPQAVDLGRGPGRRDRL